MVLADTIGGGVGLIDYDNDGWLDIYFVNGCPIPFDTGPSPSQRLYRNQRDGTFREVTDEAGVAGQVMAWAARWAITTTMAMMTYS